MDWHDVQINVIQFYKWVSQHVQSGFKGTLSLIFMGNVCITFRKRQTIKVTIVFYLSYDG